MPGALMSTSIAGPDSNEVRRGDSVRTAGVLLLVACEADLLIWGIERLWGWTPSPLGIADTVLQAVLAFGLIRSGRRWALPALVFIAFMALVSCVRNVLAVDADDLSGLLIVLSVPFVLGLLRLSPFLLLLAVKGTRIRYAAAIGLYVLHELVELAGAGLSIYTVEWIKRHR